MISHSLLLVSSISYKLYDGCSICQYCHLYLQQQVEHQNGGSEGTSYSTLPSLLYLHQHHHHLIPPVPAVLLGLGSTAFFTNVLHETITYAPSGYYYIHPHLVTSVIIGFEVVQSTSSMVECVEPLISANPKPLPKMSGKFQARFVSYLQQCRFVEAKNILKGVLTTKSNIERGPICNILHKKYADTKSV